MKLNITLLISAVLQASIAAADNLIITTKCTTMGTQCSSWGAWQLRDGSFSGPHNFNEGCRFWEIPTAIEYVCYDWANGRAKFQYKSDGAWGCVEKLHAWRTHSNSQYGTIDLDYWQKADCHW